MDRAEAQKRYRAAQEIFFEAADLSEPERSTFVVRRCAGDDALLETVRDLLRHDGAALDDLENLHAHAVDDLLEKETRFGPFRLQQVLGRGGMGVVYRAIDALEKPVAVKVIPPMRRSPASRARFRREVHTLKRLQHPGICRLLDAGEFTSAAGVFEYLSMDLIEGETLRGHLKNHDLSQRDRLFLLRRILESVRHAHDMGIVHRDLKPENIMVRPNGEPVLLDFGVAHLMESDPESDTLPTRAGQMLGTFKYMSPEQARSEPVDERSDLYSFGVVAHEMLSGSLPYSLRSHAATALLLSVATEEPCQISNALAPEVRSWLEKALDKDVEQRFQSAAAMKAGLDRVLQGHSVAGTRRRWLRGRWRSFLGQRAGISLGVAAVLAALVLVAQFRTDRQQTQQAEALLVHRITQANQAIHMGSRTRAGLLNALDQLTEAGDILTSLPHRPYHDAVRRFIEWRSGEVCFFLGGIMHEPDWFFDADSYWRRADQYRDADESDLLELPAPQLIRNEIKHLDRHHARSGRGLAHAELARYKAPVEHWAKARGFFRSALVMWANQWDMGHDPFSMPELNRFVVHDLGGAFVRGGIAADSLALVQEGLEILERVVEHPHWQQDHMSYAAYLHSRGMGHWALWLFEGEAQHLDQAEESLRASAVLRNELDGNINYVFNQRDLCRVYVARAQSTDDPVQRAAHFAAAEAALVTALGRLGELDQPFEKAEIELEAAAKSVALLHAGLADDSELQRTRERLDSLENVFTRSNYPLQWARVQHVRVALMIERFQRTGSSKHLGEALAISQQAQAAVVPQEHPRLARLLREQSDIISVYR